jgi:hypothetical protein
MTKKYNNYKAPDPDKLKPGRGVYVKWTNGTNYKGIVKRKLRTNYEIEIDDDQWHYSHNLASVPAYALIPNNYPNAVQDQPKTYDNKTIQ